MVVLHSTPLVRFWRRKKGSSCFDVMPDVIYNDSQNLPIEFALWRTDKEILENQQTLPTSITCLMGPWNKNNRNNNNNNFLLLEVAMTFVFTSIITIKRCFLKCQIVPLQSLVMSARSRPLLSRNICFAAQNVFKPHQCHICNINVMPVTICNCTWRSSNVASHLFADLTELWAVFTNKYLVNYSSL